MKRKTESSPVVAVDFGNTAIKMYWEETDHGDTHLEMLRIKDLAMAVDKCMALDAGGVVYASTRDLTPEERTFVEKEGWWEFTSEKEVPIDVDYDRFTLGADRLAAAVGCVAEYPGKDFLVIDAGTALTLDVVLAEGGFRGGNITPGLRLRVKSLASDTSRLPDLTGEATTVIPFAFGHNTREAIVNGTFNGMVGEMMSAFMDANESMGVDHILLTGGNHEFFAEPLAIKLERAGWSGRMKSIILDETAVGRGLIEIYRYNHDKKD